MVIGNPCYSLLRCNRYIHSKDYTGDSTATAVTDGVSGYSMKAFSSSTISRSVASFKERKTRKEIPTPRLVMLKNRFTQTRIPEFE